MTICLKSMRICCQNMKSIDKFLSEIHVKHWVRIHNGQIWFGCSTSRYYSFCLKLCKEDHLIYYCRHIISRLIYTVIIFLISCSNMLQLSSFIYFQQVHAPSCSVIHYLITIISVHSKLIPVISVCLVSATIFGFVARQ